MAQFVLNPGDNSQASFFVRSKQHQFTWNNTYLIELFVVASIIGHVPFLLEKRVRGRQCGWAEV